MKIWLNRVPYMCRVIEDHRGEKDGYYVFGPDWSISPTEFEKEWETDQFWIGKIHTFYDGQAGGWMRVELAKECFDVVEE